MSLNKVWSTLSWENMRAFQTCHGAPSPHVSLEPRKTAALRAYMLERFGCLYYWRGSIARGTASYVMSSILVF
jgi:hypothetical protein